MVNVFGGKKRGAEGPPGERGPPGKNGRDALNIIKWFPELILTEIRQQLNILSLLIEDKDTDVTMDKSHVRNWNSRSKKMPCSFTGYGGMITSKKLFHDRWGLVFDSSIYQTKRELLSIGIHACLTMTFSCENTKDRQHVINDYLPKYQLFRGISIHLNKLCLHGVKDDKEIIISDIEEDLFYTLQILWGGTGHEEDS